MNMNLISAVLLSLWVAGWALAMVRAGLQVRAAEIAGLSPRELPRASGLTGR